MQTFLDPSRTSLKICGVTTAADAASLTARGVHALGFNFWHQSKRYLDPDSAKPILRECSEKTIRVGVFVNADPALPKSLLEEGYIDIAQFHGDESTDYCAPFASAKLPFIKAIGVKNKDSLNNITQYQANAVLLDTPAPGVYGGTGETFDWTHAARFIQDHPELPVILAGGIIPENAGDAISQVHPAAIDVASGAEISPGIKDLQKVDKLLKSLSNN